MADPDVLIVPTIPLLFSKEICVRSKDVAPQSKVSPTPEPLVNMLTLAESVKPLYAPKNAWASKRILLSLVITIRCVGEDAPFAVVENTRRPGMSLVPGVPSTSQLI